MKIKIRDSVDGPNLCEDCSYSMIVTHDNYDKYTYCRGMSVIRDTSYLVLRKVIKCSMYDQEKQVSLWDMREIALVLRTDESGKPIGFKHYKDLDRKEQNEVDNL
jgi:hypothetical protein